MADTYEKDLAQKSSLTTSDFIRVVGSDNVSYKQGMTSVKSTLGVTALENKFTLIPSGSDLNDYHATGFYAIQTSSTNVQNCPSGYSALIVIGASATGTAHQICYNNSGIWKRSYTGSPAAWTDWEKTPTRAEVDALTNKQVVTATAYSNRVTINSQTCYRLGNVVYVNIDLTANQALSQNTAFQGLPVPSAPQYLSISVNNAYAQITSSAGNGIIMAGVSSGQRIWLSGSYVI